MLAYRVTFFDWQGHGISQFVHASLARKPSVLAEQAAIGAAWLALTNQGKAMARRVGIEKCDP